MLPIIVATGLGLLGLKYGMGALAAFLMAKTGTIISGVGTIHYADGIAAFFQFLAAKVALAGPVGWILTVVGLFLG
jgi:hypothetical protein